MKNKLKTFLSNTKPSAVRLLKAAATMLVSSLIVVHSLPVILEKLDESKFFTLTLFISQGGSDTPAARMLVTKVRRMRDGSICFLSVQEDKEGCVKSTTYMLVPSSVE